MGGAQRKTLLISGRGRTAFADFVIGILKEREEKRKDTERKDGSEE